MVLVDGISTVIIVDIPLFPHQDDGERNFDVRKKSKNEKLEEAIYLKI